MSYDLSVPNARTADQHDVALLGNEATCNRVSRTALTGAELASG